MVLCSFIKHARFQIRCCFTWVSKRRKPSHQGQPSTSLHWVTGKATLTGTWLGCCAGEPLLRGCCETAAGSILLMCVMKRSRSFKAGLRLQIIFSTCFKKRKSEFSKKGSVFTYNYCTQATLAQQKMEKDIAYRGNYNNIFLKLLTFGPLLITNLKKTLPVVRVVQQSFVKRVTQLTFLKVHTSIN